MGAFFSGLITKLLKSLITSILGVLKNQVGSWIKRLLLSRNQKKKDEELKIKYDQAVNNGTSAEIEQATEDALNG